MRTIKKIESRLEEFKNWDWLWCRSEDDKEFESFFVKEDFAEAAKKWNMSERAVRDINTAFEFLAEQLIEAIHNDLADIWEAVERLASPKE